MKKLLFILVLTLSCAVSCLALPPIPQNKVEEYRKEINQVIDKNYSYLPLELNRFYQKALQLQKIIKYTTDAAQKKLLCSKIEEAADNINATEMDIWVDIMEVIQHYVDITPYVPPTGDAATAAIFFTPYLDKYNINNPNLQKAMDDLAYTESKIKRIYRGACGYIP